MGWRDKELPGKGSDFLDSQDAVHEILSFYMLRPRS